MHLSAAGLAAVLIVAAPAVARADDDYLPANESWNGLSDFGKLAESQGMTVEYAGDLFDWSKLAPSDVLVILYPTVEPEPTHLGAFVRQGGRLLLADDFGKSEAAFAHFGVRHRTGGVSAQRYWQDNPVLPIADAAGDHPLSQGVDAIVTNHPSSFYSESGDVIFTFGDGQAVAVAGTEGLGRWVCLSDPSVLINAMLQFDGNAQFASNVIGWLMPDEARGPDGGRIIVLTGRGILTGEPPDGIGWDKAKTANEKLEAINRWLLGLNDYIANDATMRALGIFGAFAILVIGLLLLPLARDRQKLDGSWTRAAGGAERADFERLLAHYDDEDWDGSYAYPAALLRELYEQRLGGLSGVEAPLVNLEPHELIRRVQRKAGQRAADVALDAIPRLAALPTREQTQGVWGTRHVSRREFDKTYDAARALDKAMGDDAQVR